MKNLVRLAAFAALVSVAPLGIAQTGKTASKARDVEHDRVLNEINAQIAASKIAAFSSIVERAIAYEDAKSVEDVCVFLRRDPSETECPPKDPWGTQLALKTRSEFSSYFIVSAGVDKEFEEHPAFGPQRDFNRDLIYFNGALVQYPRVVAEKRPEDLRVVTMDEYGGLRQGMKINIVRLAIGAPGTELSQSTIGGFTTVSYQWKNADGSNAVIIFQDGLLVSKAQFGLK